MGCRGAWRGAGPCGRARVGSMAHGARAWAGGARRYLPNGDGGPQVWGSWCGANKQPRLPPHKPPPPPRRGARCVTGGAIPGLSALYKPWATWPGEDASWGWEGRALGTGGKGKGFGDARAPRQDSAPTAGFSSHASKVGQGRGSWGRLGISSRQEWEKPMLQPSCCFPPHAGLGGTAHPTKEVLRCPMPFPGSKAP